MAPSPRIRSPPEVDSGECKRFRLSSSLMDDFRGGSFSTAFDYENERKGSEVSVEVIDHSDPYAVADLIREIDHSGMFGSVTRDIMDCTTRMHEVLGPIMSMSPWVINALRPKEERDIFVNENKKMVKTVASKPSLPIVIIDSDDEEETGNMTTPSLPCQQVRLEAPVEQLPLPILPYQQVRLEAPAEQLPLPILPYRQVRSEAPAEQLPLPILPYRKVRLEAPVEQLPLPILRYQQVCLEAPLEKLPSPILPHQQICLEAPVEQLPLPILPYQQVSLEAPVEQLSLPYLVFDHTNSKKWEQKNMVVGDKQRPGDLTPSVELGVEKGPNEFIGVEEYSSSEIKNEDDDGLGDIWTEMSFALECSKEASEDLPTDDRVKEGGDYCDHSFILKDDIGYVCRICGLIDKSIETIIEVQFPKAKRSTRTYISSESSRDGDSNGMLGFELSEEDRVVTDLVPHPRHRKQMKAHQFEGFKFLCSNLVTDKPGGCILAHAPGSGKTFMIISFVQSFLAKNPQARPLVVMPKGILPTWKREFQTWQVEDIPLYDFYSVKADNRQQQLEVLKKWVAERSILFLGYQQFAKIVCEEASNKVATSCQEILLKRPSILILDEGHTPRNEKTDNLQSLAKVQTPRKVVLSGTLYQNHVKEVFNILNLVRPRFLKSEASRGIVRRIMSKVQIPSEKKFFRHGSDETFYDLVEHTIQKAPFKQKVAVIQDLREMTSKVLHYYRGDFLDELPGLVDFTVILNLSSRQKAEVHKLHSYTRKFKMISVGSALYLHPKLNNYSEDWPLTDENMDKLLEGLYLEHGVKAKFFLNMLRLCESAKEKLLVFSQYLPPLKFLERLTMKIKGWALGREIFVISGESSTDQREWSMEKFNTSSDAKVFFGSIKACGEGISLVGASRIIILDVHLNPSVTRQAIGRAFRPGQKKKVHVYRLVAADSPEEEDHKTCFRKEVIAKMWFEWNERWGNREFEVEKVEFEDCDDLFLESPPLREDVKVLYRR